MDQSLRSTLVQAVLFLPVGLMLAWFGVVVCLTAALVRAAGWVFQPT